MNMTFLQKPDKTALNNMCAEILDLCSRLFGLLVRLFTLNSVVSEAFRFNLPTFN